MLRNLGLNKKQRLKRKKYDFLFFFVEKSYLCGVYTC